MISPLLITPKRYVHEKENHSNNHNALFTDRSLYLRLPDYHITNSISFSSADTRDTALTVIVYKCWGIDGVIKDIENEHNKINGTPTTLEINLYYPTYYLHNNSKPFQTITFEYNKKE